MFEGTKEGGTSSSQDRAVQPKRAGGNSSKFGIEKHDQKKATKIGIQGAGGAGKDTGLAATWGAQRECGGNTANAPIEKHNRGKGEFVDHENGKSIAQRTKIPTNIEKSQRDAGAGNEKPKSHEKNARGSHTVSALKRFKK